MSKYRIILEGKTYEMEVELIEDEAAPQPAGKRAYKEYKSAAKDPTVRLIDPSAQKVTTSHPGTVTSPMPGTVLRLNKAAGDEVKAGDVVLILEAMKMENEITAPISGRILKMNAAAGATVAGGEVLFEIQ